MPTGCAAGTVRAVRELMLDRLTATGQQALTCIAAKLRVLPQDLA
ncbi:hypothetical protein [Nocardia brasiliensis]|nr:hypothetical protein [Nocardia brasiliensis]